MLHTVEMGRVLDHLRSFFCIPSRQGPVLPGSKDGAVWVCEKCGAKFSGNSINKVSSFKGLSNNDVGLV